MRVLFKRGAHFGGEQPSVRIEAVRRGRVEFAHQREDLADVALHVEDRNIEPLVARALLKLGADLVRLGDLRDREVPVLLGLHVIDAGELGEALRLALRHRPVPLDVRDHRLEARDELEDVDVLLDADLVGEAYEFELLRHEARFGHPPNGRQLLERRLVFRLRGLERGLDVDQALGLGLLALHRWRTTTVHVR